MQNLRFAISIIILGVILSGCKKEPTPQETMTSTEAPPKKQEEPQKEEETRKEAAMGLTLQWLGHASFKICHEDTILYIDPWKLKDSPHDATLVLVSHSHYDHYSPDDIAKVSGPDTKLIASPDVIAKEKKGESIMSGIIVKLDGVNLTGVAAYNPDKDFHPKSNNWVGFVIEIDSKRIYYAGDTDLTEEMKALQNIDVALLPVGGTYTMDAAEAAEAVEQFKPKMAIPYHWGDIVGGRSDAEQFAKAAKCETKILTPGETIHLK
ncbi:MAG: MBL fold metallo-hydrolase [Sedimentisphaerales bacterium]|nr:MBL fold metallo-hydrolase [Sedimentisphaerales bacterium]